MATKYFRNADGSYIGGFDGQKPEQLAAMLPAGAVEVPSAPDHAAQIWDGTKWAGAIPISIDRIAQIEKALIKKGTLTKADIDKE